MAAHVASGGAGAPSEAEVGRRTFAAQVEGTYAKLPLAVLSHLPTGGAVAWLLRQGHEPWLVAGWLGSLWALVAARLLLLRSYRSGGPAASTVAWARRALLGTIGSGLLWGAGLALLLPGAGLPERLAVYAIVAGMIAGSAGTLGDLLQGFTAFEVPVVLPVLAITAISREPIERLLAPLVLLYALAIWLVAWRAGLGLATALSMRFRNEALVEGLAAAQARLEGLNAGLEATVRERSERLLRAERELAHAAMLASVGSLATGVAHDVNSPLSGALANLAWMERELGVSDRAIDRDEFRQAVDETRAAALRVRDSVRHLSRIGRGDTRPEPVDVREVVEACLAVTAPALRARVRIVRELEEVPPVVADRPSLAQVFLWLLQRAARLAPDGAEATLRVVTRTVDGHVEVEFTDSGDALTPGALAHLSGAVLERDDPGLVLCHDTIGRLGGVISARNGPEGAVVNVRLPAAPPAR